MTNLLLIGGGGREHSLALALASCKEVSHIYVSPGNAGTATMGHNVSNIQLDIDDHQVVIEACVGHGIGLVVVGPEGPLADGIVDALSEANIKAFGPTKKAAQIEANKAWAKEFMNRHGIPTAQYRNFTEQDSLEVIGEFIESTDWKGVVVKASGLAAGKGVIVEDTKAKAKEAVAILRESSSPEIKAASNNLVIEEKLEGFEVSVLAFTDGRTVTLMPPAQDYKKRFAGDMGPNTGGMGAYAPCSLITEDQVEYVKKHIIEKTIAGLKEEGISYSGVLYAGLMVTSNGPRVLEFNCRFGDPETQVLTLLLRSNLYQIMESCIDGKLHATEVKFATDLAAVVVNIVVNCYPSSVKRGLGRPILGLEEVSKLSNVTVIVAGAKRVGTPEETVTSGGRVLSICSSQGTFQDSVNSAMEAASLISFRDTTTEFRSSYRPDIGFRPILEEMKHQSGRLTYKAAGVDIDEANSLIPRIKDLSAMSKRIGVKGELGLFGGVFDASLEGFKHPLLVSGTDGVGTKLKVAIEYGVHDTIGIDLVAMSVNDILMHGAEPLFFLDYLATGHIEKRLVYDVIHGVARGCAAANCSLIGGETAEMPGVYGTGEYDLAGFAVGAVESNMMLPKMEAMTEGDALIGIASSGLHSNGFSLVRRLIESLDLKYTELAPFSSVKTLGETLLTPTFIYTPLVEVFKKNLILGAAHITGGGLEGNIMRIIPENLAVRIDNLWPIPSVFAWLHGLKIPVEESLKTFNMGLGVVLVVKRELVASVMECLAECFKGKMSDPPAEYLPTTEPVRPYTSWVIGSLHQAKESRPLFEIEGIEERLTLNASVLSHFYPKFLLSAPKKRVAVLISGTGTNLQALLDHTMTGLSQAKISLVISNKEGAGGLEKAKKVNVPTKVIPHQDFSSRSDFEAEIQRTLKDFKIDIIVLAGFMRILTGSFVKIWRGRMINIHPSLLPSFKGKDAQAQALKAGVTVTGCTAHFVEEEVDCGAIIYQEAVPVMPKDTVDSLSARIRVAEHKVLPRAMELVARGKPWFNAAGS